MVLATDMGKHNGLVEKLKAKADELNIQDKRASAENGGEATNHFDISEDDKIFFLCMLLHTSDISNPTKPFGLAKRWAKKIVEEWYIQGDDEKSRKMKPLAHMDRATN